ncbi:MAG: hypothetical protein PHI58_01830 [Candidatus Omnitrophica bacterium]|nr:hypothetical protein [Candidatus Omnitrophota bacterium]
MMRIFAPVLIIAFTVISPFSIFAADDAPMPAGGVEPEWVKLETGYLTVYYLPGADVEAMERRLKSRATYFDSDIPGDAAPSEEKMRYQLDALFRHAQAILDMRPANIHVNIRIFRTREALEAEYAKIFPAGTPTEEDLKAFYVNKYNTIYVSEEDISDSVIAHEMGHAIVDHYFAVVPPEKIRELLASYVDLHLAE